MTDNDNDDDEHAAQVPSTQGEGNDDDFDNDEDSESQEKNSASDNDDDSENYEPAYDKANSISFAVLCNRMERLWSLKLGKKKISELEKKQYLLPPTLLKNLEPQSIFPLLRLLLPDYDNSRNVFIKEKLIAQAYCDAESFSKGTKNYEMLHGYTDPQKVPHSMAGDLSRVVQYILERRIPNRPSKLTLGQMNAFLDELGSIGQRRRISYNHEWRNATGGAKKPPKKSAANLREQWLRKVMSKGSPSPLEHKWLVRILLRKMEFGLGWKPILNWVNPFAIDLWNAHNSLKNVCDRIADPEFTKMQREEQARKQQAIQADGQVISRWEPQDQPAALGNTISPMLSSRVSFADCMTKLEYNHREFCKTAHVKECLALKFPAICAEIKLDGERMIVHVQKGGQVTMQTRNGKWYSQLYSPVLGPAIRRALSKYNVNVILDGEVESWDDGRQELIPFGQNRAVANGRRGYMQRHGLEEAIDLNLHAPSDGSPITDPNIMQIADDSGIVKNQLKDGVENGQISGMDCWLQYLVFDILYVDGPDAKQLFRDCKMDDESICPGSVIHLTLLQRKLLLYQLLSEQPKQVEIGKAVVIRPNGDCVDARQYFSTQDPLMDGDYPGALLDSTQTAIQDCMPENLPQLDRERRQGRSDTDISRLRAKAVEQFYSMVVEEYKMEGLVLKDLASPYILGVHSRSRKYWHKFKPDYEHGQSVDVVILGAYFATGLRHSGMLSHFLCGVLDENDPSSFMTAMSVNGKSVTYEKLDKIMEITGYKAATADEPAEMGKWFEMDDHGKAVPDFISHRSYQRQVEDFDGWSFSRNTYPDLWIRPEDSFVLEIKGQELVPSKELSAGLTMRFPRIKYIRHEAFDGGAKSPYECDTHYSLFQIYYETMRQRQESSAALTTSISTSTDEGAGTIQGRFLTPEEYARKPKKRKRKEIAPSAVPKVEETKSQALLGVAFTILEGNYSLQPDSIEALDARSNGWLEQGLNVKSKEDVMTFILSHSGTIRVSAGGNGTFVIGGREDDARVITYMKGIQYAKSRANSKAKSEKAIRLQEMAMNEGVLKWTFVFSIVHRWLTEREEDAGLSASTIKESKPWLLRPNDNHYLARTGSNECLNDDSPRSP